MLTGFNNQTDIVINGRKANTQYITTRRGQTFEVGKPMNNHQRRAQAAIARKALKKMLKDTHRVLSRMEGGVV